MAWVVRDSMVSMVSGFAVFGRSVAMNIRGSSGTHPPMTIIGMHMPVSDDPFPYSLVDVADLLSRRRRGVQAFLIGDTNTHWPAVGGRGPECDDAGSGSTAAARGGRASRHRRRRQQFAEVARAFGLRKCPMRVPAIGPGGPWNAACTESTFTLIPVGERSAVESPSSLDGVWSSVACTDTVVIEWRLSLGDHACLLTPVSARPMSRSARRWRLASEEAYALALRQRFDGSIGAEGVDMATFVAFTTVAMAETADRRGAAARRRARVPPGAREALHAAQAAVTEADRQQSAAEARRLLEEESAERRSKSVREEAARGRAIAKQSHCIASSRCETGHLWSATQKWWLRGLRMSSRANGHLPERSGRTLEWHRWQSM